MSPARIFEGEQVPGELNVFRRVIVVGREFEQQRLVAQHIFQDCRQHMRVILSGGEVGGTDAGQTQETAEPPGIARQKREGMNGDPFGAFLVER
jgi:hypothetical protein